MIKISKQMFMDGKSCANCSSCFVLHKHPWNKDIGKGSIMEPMGYFCMMIDDEVHPIFMDSDSGCCENWQLKQLAKENKEGNR